MASSIVTIRHNFEAAHRLPHLAGKCVSLHGHSWWAEISLTGPLRADGTVVLFGEIKAAVRGWIDSNLDHATMLGSTDPLAVVLAPYGCRLYRFGVPGTLAADLLWPTVENVAILLAAVAAEAVADFQGVSVCRVKVVETHANSAEYVP